MITQKGTKTEKNKWKKLFYSLLSFNMLILIAFLILIFWPVSESNPKPNSETTLNESSEFVVRTTKQNLNALINAYLEQVLNNSRHQYRILLEDDVHLMGELPVFNTTVPLSVHLEPFVQKNGDIILKQRSISIGLLELPNQKIMEYMKKYLDMPEWVSINPKEEEVYVAVTDIELKSNFNVSVERIDLEANNLAFRIQIPYKTLGIDELY
ncbi:YpmS family protein [Oceanobacillus sp. Castelsardo]|uniref:YpmS family protein n=1 Tax=Oceanobacillus sp. Castelsardo TaxID=1851204 RepID=UPI000838DE0F|nr:YpmS family protein [Oceanobacillus sp. Castelsardo]